MAATQRAAVAQEQGKLQVVNDWPVPVRQPGEVLIKQSSTSVNPVDWYVAKNGEYGARFPKCLGGDIAGTVIEADPSSRFKPGDKVFALAPWYLANEHAEGGYCELVSAKEEWLAHVPDVLPLDEAGGVPLVALTAVQAMSPIDNAPAPARVLVTAASGGMGHFAVQIAKAAGHYVVGTAGPTNQDLVRSLGADEALDYSTQDVEAVYKHAPFDIVVDCVGGADNMKKLFAVVKPGGTYSHIMNRGTDGEVLASLQAASDNVHVHTTLVQPSGAQLQRVAELIAAGKVKQLVAAKLPLEEVLEAHKLSQGGRTRGKIVLTL